MNPRFKVARDKNLSHDWFINSWNNMISDRTFDEHRWLDGTELYEHYYGVKLDIVKHTFSETVISVEFPSEEEATMFMLRWS